LVALLHDDIRGDGMKFFIVDDVFLIREGFKQVIKTIAGAEFCGESESLHNLSFEIKVTKADVVILDLDLCETPLKALINNLRQVSPEIRVVVFSDCQCELPVLAAIHSGVKGFIQKKNLSKEDLLTALKAIIEGKEYYSQEVTRILIGSYGQDGVRKFNFSQRELEILGYITHGKSNEQIGQLLFLSENTIATHRRNIMKKAGVNKTTDLIIWARENKVMV
jgi:DNA-binding NarL/FixJ family response regulator